MTRIRAISAGLLLLFITLISPGSLMSQTEPTLFFGLALDGYPVTAARLDRLKTQSGISPAVVVFFLQWPENPGDFHFPAQSFDAIDKSNAVPCLTWEPMYISNGKEQAIPADEILRGRYDSFIRDFARKARMSGKLLLLRFAHEMNISRYHWGTTETDYGPDSPGLYISMFKHVAGIFQAEKAENVKFIFCPNSESIPHPIWSTNGKWNTGSAWYPGNNYVDILGIDGYNWGTTQTKKKHGWDSRFRSFREIMEPMYKELKEIAPDKPIIVFETSCTDRGGDKEKWIRDTVRISEAWNIKGLVWFEADKEVDWRLNTGIDSSTIRFLRNNTSDKFNPGN